nr:hypothetical protein [Nocardia brasiliensis]
MVDNNSLRREIGSFYDSYSAAYVEVIAGRPTADEYFYRKYYSIPLYVNEAESGDADASGKRSRWLLTDSDIHDFCWQAGKRSKPATTTTRIFSIASSAC